MLQLDVLKIIRIISHWILKRHLNDHHRPSQAHSFSKSNISCNCGKFLPRSRSPSRLRHLIITLSLRFKEISQGLRKGGLVASLQNSYRVSIDNWSRMDTKTFSVCSFCNKRLVFFTRHKTQQRNHFHFSSNKTL